MKKIKRILRLGTLKFYWRNEYYTSAGFGQESNVLYMCAYRQHDLKSLLQSFSYKYAAQLTGTNLHDMLCRFRDGKLESSVHFIPFPYNGRNSIACKKLSDLVDITYRNQLIEKLAGL